MCPVPYLCHLLDSSEQHSEVGASLTPSQRWENCGLWSLSNSLVFRTRTLILKSDPRVILQSLNSESEVRGWSPGLMLVLEIIWLCKSLPVPVRNAEAWRIYEIRERESLVDYSLELEVPDLYLLLCTCHLASSFIWWKWAYHIVFKDLNFLMWKIEGILLKGS